MRPIKQGDYFLLPFAGRKRDLLVRAIEPCEKLEHGQWRVDNLNGTSFITFLPSCHRCSPSLAARIMHPET